MSNAKWMASLSKHARDALQNCVLENRWPVFKSYKDYIAPLSTQALKTKKEWLTDSDVYDIFRKAITTIVNDKFPVGEEVNGKFKELFDEECIARTSEEIANFIDSIPREYFFYFPLPGLKDTIADDVNFSETLSLKVLKKESPLVSKNRFLAAFDLNKPAEGIYLVVKEHGYAGSSLEDSATARALSKLKQVVHLGNIRTIFKPRDIPFGFGLGGFGGHHAPNLNVFIVDSKFTNECNSNFLLPINTSRHIDLVSINSENAHYKNFVVTNKLNLSDYLMHAFSMATLLTDSKEEGAESVRTAIEWAFDASANDNDTIAFLQVCIGLEALFGDSISNESLAASLADRCAYFISTNISGRKNIRENFRDLYVRRSKLVHGRRNRISDEDRYCLEWGKQALNYAIWKEIGFLEAETQK